MKCPHCDEVIQDGALKCRWCREFVTTAVLVVGSVRSRPLAAAECDRLITMAVFVGAGVAFIPIPGTSVTLTGLELLLMGAMAAVWGCPLTGTLVTTVVTAMAVRLGLTTALAALAEFLTWIPLVGIVAKPAVAATTIKLVGSGLNDIFAVFYGAEHPAALTAEQAKQRLDSAFQRVLEYGPELRDGLAAAFRGDGKPLAALLNRIFGLGKPAQQPGQPTAGAEPPAEAETTGGTESTEVGEPPADKEASEDEEPPVDKGPPRAS